jgi:pimeloyl-ACP methyl ester carboxylesterase
MQRLGPVVARSIQSLGARLVRSAWHDPSKVTPEVEAGYRKPLQVENWDRALWELTRAGHALNLGERLGEIQVPVLVFTGAEDQIVPAEQSVRLAQELPNAELVVIPNCGHVPQEECPEQVLSAITWFLSR